jgi:hypothetical protein
MGENMGVRKRLIKEKNKKLEILQKNENGEDGPEVKKLQKEIDFLLEQEDIRWKQRAKQNWYRQGDRNTQFFHSWANHRRKINQIQKIQDEDGRIWKEPEEISKSFLAFYQDLFTTSGVHGVEECLVGLETRVTDEMNGGLLRVFTMGEVDFALKQMHPTKSPGPDGMSACFYQNAWSTIRIAVCSAVLGFLNGGSFEATINETYITLIPKIKNPSRITEYRPISLCNVFYKLIAKVLANRLKKVLPHIISANQSAFVPGRLITDNVLVAFEALQTMDVRMKGKLGYMALKLDMSKAYDRVEWDFLEAVMLKIGFARRWVDLLMVCIRTVTYSVLINGQPHGKIVPTRGIRQGDPLSPYFFILCAEGLSTMLRRAEQEGRLTGLPISRGGTRISHLFFADDSLLFCRSSILEWARIQEILEAYERASGQKLNREKTSIFFSKNTKREAKEFILSTAGVTSTASYERYLGLPALIGRAKVNSFSVLKGRIWERMNGWKEKFLSQAGKEVLLKAVVQAIPTYTMSVFQLPKTLCKEICSMMSKFWWGHKGNDARIAWMSWSKMGRAKEKGGLGFRDIELFNLALLAKQGWRLLQQPDSLVAKVFKEKYFPNCSFLDSNLGSQPSYAWRSIYNAKPLLFEGLVWRVGDGSSIKIWTDRWLPTMGSHKVQSPVQILSADATVSELLDTDTNWWKTDLIFSIFGVDEAEAICSMPVCPRTTKDKLVWVGTKHGDYTVRSAYHMGKENGLKDEGSCSTVHQIAGIWKGVWRINCARVVKMFLWQACNNILPTKELLFKRHISEDPLCPICGLGTETIVHILWSCPSARDVWMECDKRLHKCTSDEMDFIYVLEKLMDRLDGDQMMLVVTVARQIWFRRNSIVFGGEMVDPGQVVRRAKDQVEAWCSATQRPVISSEVSALPVAITWARPPEGYVKVNWDASVNKHHNKMGVGVVVRDSTGAVLAMLCTIRKSITSPAVAETVGAWAAVELAKRMGLRRVIFEGDALEIIQALTRDGESWAIYGQMLNEIKSVLMQNQDWSVQYVSRVANGVAHNLARRSFMYGDDREWRTEFPISVEEVVP